MNVVITCMLAYPLSKRNFAPVKVLMLAVVFTMIFKAPTIPYFLTLRGYGLYNSFWAMVVPQVISAYNLLVMRSFFQSFPAEIEEAAEIDGCGKFRMFFRIVLPSSKAVIATVGLFYGVGAWNQYATPLMMIQDTALFPLQLKIHQLVNAASGDIAAAVKVSNSTIARLERNEILLPGSDLIRALSEELGVDNNYLLAKTHQIDDEPEIRIIQRAARNMSKEDRQRMVEILRLTFRDAFADIRDDEGNIC